MTREAARTIGFLDETLFYTEDMDLCLRAHKAGWKIVYLASCSIVHLGGGSTKRAGNFGLHRKIAFQSLWLFTRKHHGAVAAAIVSGMVLGWSLGAVAVGWALSLVFKKNTKQGETARVWRTLAWSLMQWSIGNKKRFRHHLATDPQL
jgi:GT2 family glycosyltransferase